MLVIELNILEHDADQGEEVIVENDVEVIDDGVPQVDDQVGERLFVVNFLVVASFPTDSSQDSSVGVLVLTDDQPQVGCSVLDFCWEVF